MSLDYAALRPFGIANYGPWSRDTSLRIRVSLWLSFTPARLFLKTIRLVLEVPVLVMVTWKSELRMPFGAMRTLAKKIAWSALVGGTLLVAPVVVGRGVSRARYT